MKDKSWEFGEHDMGPGTTRWWRMGFLGKPRDPRTARRIGRCRIEVGGMSNVAVMSLAGVSSTTLLTLYMAGLSHT